MQHTLWVPGAPKVKGRPRHVKNTGRTYTPKETLAEEERLGGLYKGPMFEGHVGVEVVYYKDGQIITIYDRPDPAGKFRGDLDNYLKLTGDALQGKAFSNDKQVTKMVGLLDGALVDGDLDAFLDNDGLRLGTIPDMP